MRFLMDNWVVLLGSAAWLTISGFAAHLFVKDARKRSRGNQGSLSRTPTSYTGPPHENILFPTIVEMVEPLRNNPPDYWIDDEAVYVDRQPPSMKLPYWYD